jgi:DNA-binding CsgD family transcriptional regulator
MFMEQNDMELSSRESEILQLIYEGFTDNEMAEELSISPNTVRTHRQNLRTKFSVNNTAEMINKAVELKLVKNNSK